MLIIYSSIHLVRLFFLFFKLKFRRKKNRNKLILLILFSFCFFHFGGFFVNREKDEERKKKNSKTIIKKEKKRSKTREYNVRTHSTNIFSNTFSFFFGFSSSSWVDVPANINQNLLKSNMKQNRKVSNQFVSLFF